jgi:hypothetical protein
VGIVAYVMIAAVVVGLVVLVVAALPVLRRLRPLAAALAATRRYRGEVAVLADRVDRLNTDLAQVRVRADAARSRMTRMGLNGKNHDR